MAASDEAELVRMINTSVNINDRPSAFRYPRGNGLGIELPDIKEQLKISNGRTRSLENWRNYILGGMAIITFLLTTIK